MAARSVREYPAPAGPEGGGGPRWRRGWIAHWLAYPSSWANAMLRSRLARWAPAVVTGAGYVYASAPDFGITRVRGGWGLVGLFLFWVAGQNLSQLLVASRLDAIGYSLESVGGIVSSLSIAPEGKAPPRLLDDPAVAIDALLRRAQEIARDWLRPPSDCLIAAHLLIPEWGMVRGREVIVGLRAARHDDYRPDRAHQLVALDAPGAGDAFMTGQRAVVSDTDATSDPRFAGKPYKSLVAFPVLAGKRGAGGRVHAVLSLDATVPNVFTEKAVARLAPILHPIAQVIGLALVIQQRKDAT